MRFFYAYIITSSLILLAFASGCGDDKIKPNTMQITQGQLPAQESRFDKILLTEEGKLRAIVYANHIRYFEDSKETLLDTLRIEFYNDLNQKTSVLTARRGRVEELTNNMYAMDSVVASNDSGTVLRTEELMWRNKDRKIVSEKFVKITSKTEDIQGYGVVADQNLKNYVINRPTIVTTSASFADTAQ